MSNLAIINDIISDDFKFSGSLLEEKQENMKIDLDKSGCTSFIFKFDKQLGKEYKGGIYPFFNSKMKGLCKVCDYMIFAEVNKKIFVLIIELKVGQQGTFPQLNAGECFVEFLKLTIKRVCGNDLNLNVRKISIREFQRKKKTKVRDIEYDSDNHHFFEQNKFRIRSFLK